MLVRINANKKHTFKTRNGYCLNPSATRLATRFSIHAFATARERAVTLVTSLMSLVMYRHLVFHLGPLSPATYTGNQYYSASPDWFRSDDGNMDYQRWTSLTSEVGSSNMAQNSPDPDRDLASYQNSLGKEASFEAFINAIVSQGKYHWDSAYTADAVNQYLRAGF